VYDGVNSAKGWHDAPKLQVRVMSAEQHQAELQRLEEEQIQAMAQAQEAKSIMVQGQEKDDYQHGRMGMYELVEGKVVNGRGVWQLQGNIDSFLYFSRRNIMEWVISNRREMEAGEAVGWLRVTSRALTPDRVTKLWRVYDGVSSAKGWHDAPKLRVRVMSAEQHQAELQRLEEEQIQAMAQAQEAKIVMVQGQEEGDHQHGRMGMYELVEGKVVNGRGVWQNSNARFLYFSRSSREWFISHKVNMEAGTSAGRIKVASAALIPAQATEQWRISDGSSWHGAPKLRVLVMSAEQHQAELQQMAEKKQAD
jgi:hypothetical protein